VAEELEMLDSLLDQNERSACAIRERYDRYFMMNPGTITPDPALQLPEAVNKALRPFIGKFSASTSSITDQAGTTVGPFESVIHAGDDSATGAADSVAVAIICDEELTLEGLQSAYQRTQQVKSLNKTKDTDPSFNR
jgi:hypothetical protein